jgi:hypothetical protein
MMFIKDTLEKRFLLMCPFRYGLMRVFAMDDFEFFQYAVALAIPTR